MKCTGVWTAILSWSCALCTAVPLSAEQPARHTEGGCDTFSWNLSREFAALRKPAILLAASADKKVNPRRIKEGQHVALTLLPQNSVSFAAPPGHQRKDEHPTAGLLFFKSGLPGRYRISLSSRHWIDLLDGNETIESLSYEGRSGCELLRKVVEFELPASRELVLQLSGDGTATADIVITAVAKR